jgi:hypothetical protein
MGVGCLDNLFSRTKRHKRSKEGEYQKAKVQNLGGIGYK